MNRLLPTQYRWTRMDFGEWRHFNLGTLFTVPAGLSDGTLAPAVQRVVDRNPALRTAYRRGAAGWTAEERPADAATVVRAAELPDYRGRTGAMEEEIARLQGTLRPDEGEVFRVVHFPFGDEPGRLLATVHHLTLDGFSMGLVGGELDRALRGREPGPPCAAPADYVAAVEKWVASDEAAQDAGRWLDRPWDRVANPPPDLDGDATLPTMRIDSGELEADVTAALAAACRKAALRPSDVLLDAAAQAVMARWDLPAVAVDAYHVGRHLTPMGIDVIDTIGYLQNTFPIVFTARDRFDPADVRAVPDRMFGFDALRFFSGRLDDLPATTLRYNFRGHMGRLNSRPGAYLGEADEPIRRRRAQGQTEAYTLMLEGDVIDGRLVLHIKYSTGQFEPGTIADLLAGALDRVRATTREPAC
ncbi:condensation domain-containing protein [Actinomadura opuntiae]|uniref:condensation domain-containing protein n=1 Tax=Actinomadura sp. OS1-43 TaxID=604315 RepID=UPI00255B1502|nr:condensation domain-containing protein [Actinomadura sp. OS1-43]MDL4816955.1 condensation domain-containing protein [Actinomadura sp. OS1-43]